MSIWSDIHKRSNGKQIRKEDIYQEGISNALDDHIIFKGILDGSATPSSNTVGGIYIIAENTTIDGIVYNKGDLITYTSDGWKLIQSFYNTNEQEK